MSLEKELQTRANNCCELCKNDKQLSSFIIPPSTESTANNAILLC